MRSALKYPELNHSYEGFTVKSTLIGQGSFGRVFECIRTSDNVILILLNSLKETFGHQDMWFDVESRNNCLVRPGSGKYGENFPL